MIESKKLLVTAFLFPILALVGLAAYKATVRNFGDEHVFPIEGYDPRDLLSGHYLAFRVNYGVPNLCHDSVAGDRDAYVCISDQTFTYDRPDNCAQFIRGRCRGTFFAAGIEKFFIEEADAPRLERLIREKAASVAVSIMPNGEAQIKDLLIDGKHWKESAK